MRMYGNFCPVTKLNWPFLSAITSCVVPLMCTTAPSKVCRVLLSITLPASVEFINGSTDWADKNPGNKRTIHVQIKRYFFTTFVLVINNKAPNGEAIHCWLIWSSSLVLAGQDCYNSSGLFILCKLLYSQFTGPMDPKDGNSCLGNLFLKICWWQDASDAQPRWIGIITYNSSNDKWVVAE